MTDLVPVSENVQGPTVLGDARERWLARRRVGPKPRSPVERFWEKVERRGPDECWPWKGAHVPDGYGSLMLWSAGSHSRKTVKVHRYVWSITNGPVPAGIQVLHRCDIRDCVNPSHLFLGTNADNVADRVAKGRSAVQVGSRNPRARLDEDDVREIRRLVAAGQPTLELASHYGVSRGSIQRAANPRYWTHIE